jgi:hypothetical protein
VQDKKETGKKLNYGNPSIKKYGLKVGKYKTVTEDFKESEHQNKFNTVIKEVYRSIYLGHEMNSTWKINSEITP